MFNRGILSQGVDPALEEELIREMQAEEAQNQGLLAQPLQSAPPQGNRRDAIGMARSQNALPSLVPQEYKSKGILDRFKSGFSNFGRQAPDQALLALSAGLLKGAGDPNGNFFSSLGQGLEGYGAGVDAERAAFENSEQKRTQGLYQQENLRLAQEDNQLARDRFAADGPLRELQIKELEMKLKSGEIVELENGILYNKTTGETITAASEAVIAAKARVAAAEAEAQARYSPLGKSQQGNTFVDADGNYYHGIFQPGGGYLFQNASDGTVSKTLPEGAMRVEDSGLKYATKADETAETALYDSAISAPGNIARLDRLQAAAQGNTGQTYLADMARYISTRFNIPLGEFDPSNISQAKQIIADLAVDASKRMKGQGQITEFERKMLLDASLKLDMDPKAFNTVVEIMKKAEMRSQELYDAWMNAPTSERAQGFRQFVYQYSKRFNQEGGPNATGTGQSTTSTGVGWSIVE
jgi:hypothetical protein